MRIIPKIGRGKVMSIAKAMLFSLVESYPDFENDKAAYVTTGDLEMIHRAVDIAGAKQCGVFTIHQVISCINHSNLWEYDVKVRGWGNGQAACYVPSDAGVKWYLENKDKYVLPIKDIKN